LADLLFMTIKDYVVTFGATIIEGHSTIGILYLAPHFSTE